MTEDSKRSSGVRQNSRRLRTRDQLLAAAEILFAERAPDAVSIDEIVIAAGVAKGTYYNHFIDKADIIHAVYRRVRMRIETAIAEANREVDDPASRVARALCLYARTAIETPNAATVLTKVLEKGLPEDTPLNHGVFDDMREGMKRDRFRIPTVEVAAILVVAVSQQLMAHILQGEQGYAARILAQQLIAMLLAGLGLEPSEASAVSAKAVEDIMRAGLLNLTI
ncbi:TetR/AcrR family transcriptional regulator [Sphingobium boeckii]|uniref:TetR/AcrR family transcriptional regulator n=1 Tax=Sphingobium boeckii TaxID=1082345 RepID=UPI001622F9CB|nr:TetR/AcrR family transcriptional regulator [Sphingobium boeckii]